MALGVKLLQAVIFTGDLGISDKLEFSSSFVKKTGNVFNFEPQVLSLPPQAPPELPRIILRNKQQCYGVQFAKNRVNFFYQDVRNRNKELDGLFPTFRLHLGNVIEALFDLSASQAGMLAIQVSRLGFITQFFQQMSGSANHYLMEHFFRPAVGIFDEGTMSDTHQMQLSFLHRLDLENLNVNQWVKYRTLRNQKEPFDDYAIAIDVDINTLQEEQHDFDASDVLSFFMLVKEHILRDLKKFPLFDS